MIEKELLKDTFEKSYEFITRPGAAEMFAWLEENGFFTAPASTKYHGAYPGGLAEHSLNVFDRICELAEREKLQYTPDTLAVCGLLHDVCKIDAYTKDGDRYTHTNAFPAGHGEKSVILIMRKMELTDEEILAISWHMGPFDARMKGGSYDMNNAFRESPLPVLLHLADMMATHLDEREK